MNELQIFNNEQFGEIRIVIKNREPWFVGKDVADILGYGNSRQALKTNVDKEDRGVHSVDTPSGKQNMVVINESGLYALIFGSKLEKAKMFKHWVTSEVLPTLRKTGEYKVKDKPLTSLQKERESRLKAQLLYNLSKEVNIPEYKQVLQSYCTKELTGKHLLPLPEVEKPTYSAKEAGARLGISGNMFGRYANKYGLKTAEFGKLFYDKSPYSAKEVETFRYFESAIEAVRKILEQEAA